MTELETKDKAVSAIKERLTEILNKNIITTYGRADYADAHFNGANEVKKEIRRLIKDLEDEGEGTK